GGDACVPIWTTYMNRVVGLVPDVDWRRPEEVVERDIDPESGMLATPWCPQSRVEVFVAGTEPTGVCPLHGGTGEPTLVLRDTNHGFEPGEQPAPTVQQPGSPQQQQQQQRRERGIRRLLRAIFGQ